MKNFNSIKEHLNHFFEEYVKVENAFKECAQKINDAYIGDFYDWQMKLAEDAFTKKAADLKEQALTGIRNEFAVINSNIRDIVAKPCSVEVVSTLSILNPEDISEKELQLYFSKFKGNYTAMKILHKIAVEKYGSDAEKLSSIGDTFVSVDYLKDSIDYIQNESEAAINNCSDRSSGNMFRIGDLLSFRAIDRVNADYDRFEAKEGE